MIMTTKLSLCIVAYNNYQDIIAAIKSMDKYTSKNLKRKLYIVDNGVAVSVADTSFCQ